MLLACIIFKVCHSTQVKVFPEMVDDVSVALYNADGFQETVEMVGFLFDCTENPILPIPFILNGI